MGRGFLILACLMKSLTELSGVSAASCRVSESKKLERPRQHGRRLVGGTKGGR